MKLSLITTVSFALLMSAAYIYDAGIYKALMVIFGALMIAAITAIMCLLLYAIARLPDLDEDNY